MTLKQLEAERYSRREYEIECIMGRAMNWLRDHDEASLMTSGWRANELCIEAARRLAERGFVIRKGLFGGLYVRMP